MNNLDTRECKMCHGTSFQTINSDTFCKNCGSQLDIYDYHLEFQKSEIAVRKKKRTAIREKSTKAPATWLDKLTDFQNTLKSQATALKEEYSLNPKFMSEVKANWLKYLSQWEKSKIRVSGCVNNKSSFIISKKSQRYKLTPSKVHPIEELELEIYNDEEKLKEKEKSDKQKLQQVYSKWNKRLKPNQSAK